MLSGISSVRGSVFVAEILQMSTQCEVLGHALFQASYCLLVNNYTDQTKSLETMSQSAIATSTLLHNIASACETFT